MSKVVKKKTPYAPANISAMVERLRVCRDDAFSQGLSKSAAFWAKELSTISQDHMDLYKLCMAWFSCKEYHRAFELLQRFAPDSIWARHLAARCSLEIESWEQVLQDSVLGEAHNHLNRLYGELHPLDVKLNNMYGRTLLVGSSCCHLRGMAYIKQSMREQAKVCFRESLKIDPRCYEVIVY